MTIFMILAPYGVYAALMLVVSATLSMAVGAVLCVAMVVTDIARGRSIKLLAAGSAVVFATVACYRAFIDPALSASAVKLLVDGGIFAISFGSMLLRMPFTLQYAIESVPAETAAMPGFLHANYVITGAWAGAALLMMIGNVMMIYVPVLDRACDRLRRPQQRAVFYQMVSDLPSPQGYRRAACWGTVGT